MIDKARIACSLPVLEGKHHDIALLTWDEALTFAHVPTERINDCYLWAITTHDAKQPFTVAALCQAWREIQESEKYKPYESIYGQKQLAETAEGACVKCFGSGWEKLSNQDGTTAVRKCNH